MSRRAALALCFGAALVTYACATAGVNGARASAPSSNDESSGGFVDVRLSYTRPALFGSTGRPQGFEVIANYQSSDLTTEYEGIWNDSTLTLTATLRLPAGSDNLVYVVDDAVPSFVPASIQASREGRLREIGCTPAVTTVQACYQLTVIDGL